MTGFEFIGALPPIIEQNPSYYQCVIEAAHNFMIPEAIAKGILSVENGQVGMYRWNGNGTTDWGPFQINVINYPQLGSLGVRPRDLLFDFCSNANSALFYASYRAARNARSRNNEEILYAYALYHSGTPVHRNRYFGLLKNYVGYSYE